ncbi:hypothetical protein QQ008_19345 [Fulvivirgaceae bacterium BMA10]|uniref:Outer membrane protein beta-barrel domain-containing protein n=1 Tax=Splendidivirga corallicola TaxID=3051826 RepID=A0ABT8KUA3_9BACT|nr:hypothetical protein [Fulvivirgaceae bacterium BMA10]
MLRTLFIGLAMFATIPAFSQGSGGDYEYSSEIIWGINKNTNGGLIGGFILKYGRAVKDNYFETFGLELSNVKHPKEVRTQSITGNSFIWGKQNYLYAIRLQYGREKILFRKAPQQGVQINAFLAGGPTVGVVTPYYITVQTSLIESTSVPFNPNVHTNRRSILGAGTLFQGLGESQIKLGGNVKTGLNFEFGTFKRHVTGFEVGFMLEAFTEDIIIVPNAENRNIYPSAFITLFYGSRR